MADMHSPIDYAVRDARICRQTYSVIRKLDGLPHELFAMYWRDVHAPLCGRLPGLGYYVQHHSRETAGPIYGPSPKACDG